METGRLVDVDGDGQLDLLPNGAKFAAWWEWKLDHNPGDNPEWVRHQLPSEARGHGLGLAITKWIVESHGGTISVSDSEGAGTEFSIELPLTKGSTAAVR